MDNDAIYYTGDTAKFPITSLWHLSMSVSAVFGPLLFLITMVRRIPGLRSRPTYGIRYPLSLSPVNAKDIPTDVHAEFEPFVRACEEFDFQLAFYLMSENIGNRVGFTVALLDLTGTVSATVVWTRFGVGEVTQSAVAFSCHSRLHSGTRLHTSPVSETANIHIPGHKHMHLPLISSPSEVISAHFQHIAEYEKELVQFDQETLGDDMLQADQALFDYLVEKKFYKPLTSSDVQRLVG